MKASTKAKLLKAIAKKFPEVWAKDGVEWDGNQEMIWSGEGSMIDGNDAFSMYASYKTYECGVHKDFAKLLDTHGWFSEFYDAGTIHMYPM